MKNILAFLVLGCSALSAQITNGLMAHYTFDGHSNDVSGNNNHGTNNGASQATDRIGQPNMAYYFDGLNDDIFVPNSLSLNPTTAISICAWYKSVSFSGNGYSPIITKGFTSHAAPTYQYKLGVNGNLYTGSGAGRFGFSVATTNNVNNTIMTPGNFWKPNTWYFIVGTYDGNQLKLYVDNQLIASQALSGALANYPTNVKIGNNTTLSDYLQGTLDDVKMYNRALSDEEIGILYNAGKPVSNFNSSATGTICVGTTVSFTDQSSNNPVAWNWSSSPAGLIFSNPLAPNPSVTFSSPGTYTVYLQANTTNQQGTIANTIIYVSPYPVITTPVSSQIVCLGNSAAFYATGASSYTWSHNGGSQPLASYTPTVSTTYTVTGDLNGCVSSKEVTVTVMPLPTVSINGDLSICRGSSATLYAGGAFTYTWNGTVVSPSLVVSPTTTIIYQVVGTDANGCSAPAWYFVEVVLCTEIEQVSSVRSSYQVFPNPATDKLMIRSAESQSSVRMFLLDATGKLLLEKQADFSSADTAEIDLKNVAQGIYFIRLIQEDSKTQTLKIIKE